MKHYKRPKTFKQAMAIRKKALEKYKKAEKAYEIAQSKLKDIEIYCNSLQMPWDKFERYLPGPTINFSGWDE